MKKKTTWVVFHTTESGADYMVYKNPDRTKCISWEHEKRNEFPRPLIIRKIQY